MNEIFEIVWSENTDIAKTIVCLIGGISLLAVYRSIKLARRFLLEQNSLDKVKNNLYAQISKIKKAHSDDESILNSSRLADLINFNSLLKGIDHKKIIFERIRAIQTLKNSRLSVNYDLVRDTTIHKEHFSKSFRFPKYASGLCMMLGMLGTFIGLTMLVNQIVTVTDSEMKSIHEATDKIRQLMSGVGTAFSTTLMGLLGTIIINLFNYRLENRAYRFLSELEEFMVRDIIPLAPSISQKSSQDLLRDMTENFESTYSDISATIKSNENNLLQLNNIYGKFREIIDEVHHISQTNSSTQLSTVVSELTTVNTAISSIVAQYNAKLDHLGQLQKTNEQQLSDYNKLMSQAKSLPSFAKGAFFVLIFIAVLLLIYLISSLKLI